MFIDTLFVLVLSGSVVAAPIYPSRYTMKSYIAKRENNESNTSSTIRIVAVVIAIMIFLGAFGAAIWKYTKRSRVKTRTQTMASSTIQSTTRERQSTSSFRPYSPRSDTSHSPLMILDRPDPNSPIDIYSPASTIPIGGHTSPWLQNDPFPVEPPPAYFPRDVPAPTETAQVPVEPTPTQSAEPANVSTNNVSINYVPTNNESSTITRTQQ